jgi:hypothetical protein
MSKVGQWILGMQEDATWMSREQFMDTHGVSQLDIWERVQRGEDENWEPDYEPEIYEAVS